MLKRLLIITAFVIFLASAAHARTLQDYQVELGIDKIAHVTAGAACSLYLAEHVLDHRKHRKLISAAVCSFAAFQKEKSDTKSDPKDFLFSEIGIIVPLIEF